MTPGTIVLLHSPLTTAAAWGGLPAALRSAGFTIAVPEITDDDRPPYGARYVARATLEITAAAAEPPLVLVAHGDAGPLLPPIGAAQRAAHRLVGGYVFADARLLGPRPGPGHEPGPGPVKAMRPEPAGAPSGVVLRPRGEDFFAEPPPLSQDWPDAPCGYLRSSETYAGQSRHAELRGWVVAEHMVGHFAAHRDPAGTATALIKLIAAL